MRDAVGDGGGSDHGGAHVPPANLSVDLPEGFPSRKPSAQPRPDARRRPECSHPAKSIIQHRVLCTALSENPHLCFKVITVGRQTAREGSTCACFIERALCRV
jgi:hypothetical protein